MKADTASQPIPRMNAAAAAKRYDHIKTIGKGSYGTVDLVRNKTDHKLYVQTQHEKMRSSNAIENPCPS